jgi:hypothetical protein
LIEPRSTAVAGARSGGRCRRSRVFLLLRVHLG